MGDEDIKKAISLGIAKINITQNFVRQQWKQSTSIRMNHSCS
ncbi:MAG: hypothetical protein ACLTCI_09200 [[Clostridium] nexile]